LQSNSLVTLPVPAKLPGLQDGSSPSSSDDPKRIPRDTLPEREQGPSGADNAEDAQRDTLYGPEFERPAPGDMTLVSAGQESDLETASDHESIVRPMPTIDIVSDAEPSVNSCSSGSDIQATPERASDPPQNAEPVEIIAQMVSVHPLAALGFQSDAPPKPSRVSIPTGNDLEASQNQLLETSAAVEPPRIELDVRAPLSEPMRPLESSMAKAEEQADAGACNESRTPNMNPVNVELRDSDSIKLLLEQSGSRFGDEFEARVRELVVQRVAEVVAERMLRAFGDGMFNASKNGHGGAAGARADSERPSIEIESPPSAHANRPKRRARRPTKPRKSV